MFPSSWRRFLNTLSPKARGKSRKDRRQLPAKPSRRLLLERLEDRVTPSTLYVDNTPTIGGPGADMFTPNGGTQTPVGGLTLGTNLFTTIGAAVAAASPGDTIDVADGTYAESVTVNKSLLIQGNEFGADAQTRSTAHESIVDDSSNTGRTLFFVTASNVTIDGFTVQNQTNVNQFGAGIVLGAGTSGSHVLNDIIQNNVAGLYLANGAGNQTVISGNLIQNNNQPGAASGAGIYSDPFVAGASASGTLTNVLIDNNTFSGNTGDAGIDFSFTPSGSASSITVSNNLFSGNARALFLLGVTNSSVHQNTMTGSTAAGTGDIRIFGGDSGLTITNNLLQNGAGDAIKISDGQGGDPNSNISINNNSISGYGGDGLNLINGYTGTLDATNNWWGSATGPTTPNNPGGTGEAIADPNNQVTFSPYLTSGTNTASGRGFTPAANAPIGITVDGTSGADTLVVNATGPNSGTYSLNGGQPVPFSNVTRFTFAGNGGADVFIVNNPSGGLFAPTDGIFYIDNGGASLQILGGAAVSETFNFQANSAAGHNGSIALVNGGTTANYSYSGLSPVLVNAGTPTDIVFNLPNDGTDHKSILEAAAAGMDDLRSQNGTYETTTFANPSTSLTVNVGNTTAAGESLTLAALDPGFTAPNITYNGGPGDDFFTVLANPSGTTTTFNTSTDGAGGPDHAFIGGNSATAENLDNVLGSIVVNGQSGNTVLDVNDQDSTTAHGYTVTGTTVQRGSTALITYNTVQAFSLNGGSGGNNITMTGAAAGASYTINAGSGNDRITVSGTGAAAALTVNGQGGADQLQVDFAAGNPSPAGGINYHGGGQAGDNLLLRNIIATNVINTFLPDSSATPHVGTLSVDGSVVNYDGVFPVDIAGTVANLVINLPSGDGNNLAILEDNSLSIDNISQIRSGNGTFETTDFTNPTTSLTVNASNDGETLTVAQLDPAFNPTNGITFNGGPGAGTTDTLVVDFSSGVNVIPTGGITFHGTGNGGIHFLPGYTAANVTDDYTDAHSGNINVDGRTVTYSGLSQTRGIFDELAAAARTFSFPATDDIVTLGDDPTANNGISRISSTSSNPTTDFPNPTASVTVNRGLGSDTITAGPLDATSPPPTINLNGFDGTDIAADGSDTFNVTPSTGSTFHIDGDNPTPPTLPGDTLNVTIPPASNPVLTSTATPTGFTGNYAFLAGGFQPVNFQEIETLSPSTVDLSITKDDGADTEGEIPGSTITYTIVATNMGALGVTGVTITDMFPSSMPPSTAPGFTADSYTSTATGGATGNTAGPASGNINDTVTMPGGSTITYIVTATINPSSLGTLSNTATITPPTGVMGSPSSSTDADTLTPQADLGVTKTPTPSPVLAGNNLTYTITVVNNGPSTSQNVQLTDATPANTTFVSFVENSGPAFTITQEPAPGGTGFVTATDAGLLPTGTMPAVFTYVVHVSPSTANGSTINNTATVLSTTTVDTVPGNNQANTSTPVSTAADLAVTKTDSAGTGTVTAGSQLTYTIVLTNNGPSDAQSVVLTDTLTANETFVSSTDSGSDSFTPSTTGNTTTFTATGPFAPGATHTFLITAQVNSSAANGSSAGDTANVTSTTFDNNTANNTATVSNTVVTSADLAVSKAATPNPATAGNDLTYTIALTNSGPSDAQNLLLTDTVPTGTTFVSFTPAAGFTRTDTTPAGGTGTITASDPTFVGGASATFTLVVHVGPSDANGSFITNTVTANSATADPTPADNTFTTNTPVAAVADLVVSKTGPATVTAGNQLTYTITLTNNGPSDAQNVSLTDATPAGATFVSFTPGAGFNRTDTTPPGSTGTITATDTTFATGASATFTLVVMANSSDANGSTITNTANVSSTTTDDSTTDNDETSTVNTTVLTSADLTVSKAGPATITAGTDATYTITLTNSGPSDAQNVSLTDAVPTGTTFVTFTPAAGFTRTDTTPTGGTGTITASDPTFAAGASATFTLVVMANSNDADASTISNTANVSSSTADPTAADNTSTVNSTVATSADVAVKKTGPTTVTAGTDITYTITTTNNGPSDAQNVMTTDTPPANTTLVSFMQDSGPPDGGPLPAGGTETFTLVVFLSPSAPDGSTISNMANVSSTTSDPNSANNASTFNSTVAAVADLVVSKTGPTTVTAGNQLTYTIALTNNGPSDAQNVSLTDLVPTGTTFVSFIPAAGFTRTDTTPPGGAGTITATDPTFAAGASATFTIVVTANSSDANGSTITNTANVSTTTTDDDAANDETSTVNTTVLTSADLSVNKTGPATITAGTDATYTIVLTNSGPSDAQNVSLTDVVPTGTTFVSFTPAAGFTRTDTTPPGSGGTIAASDPTVAAGASDTFTLVVHANASDANGSTISNTANIFASTADPTTADNSSTFNSTVATSADLSVSKTGPAAVTAGTNATYTIVLTNSGPSDAQGVSLTDAVPTGATFVSFTPAAGFTRTDTTPAGGTGTITATDATFAAGASSTFTLVVQADSSDANGSTVSNTANVSSSTADPTTADNTSTANTLVLTSADLSVTKTGPSTITAGTDATYTIVLTNSGPSDAQNVQLTDSTPGGTAFVSFTPAAGFTRTDTTPAGGTGTIMAADLTLAAGVSATFTLVVHAGASDANGSTISNTASAFSSTADPTTADNSSTFNSTVATSADLALTKTGPATATAGTNVTYTLSVTNGGPSDAQNVSLTDTLPTGETFVSASTGTGAGTSYSSGNLGVLAANGSEIVTIVAFISPSEPNNSTLTDSATVSSSTADPTGADNTSTFNTTVSTSADLAVVKTGAATVTAGTNATYTISVTNAGPSDSQLVTLSDTVPAGSTFVSFTQNSGPTFGPANTPTSGGTGTLNDSISTFASGASATFTLVLHLASSDVNQATFSNTANIASIGTSDPNSANDSSTATAPVEEVVDLSITKTDSQPNHTANPGLPITYTIVVSNAGPSDATNATVTDTFPVNNVTFTATGTGGATGFTANGTGNINDTVNVPLGATITYIATGTVPSTPTNGILQNTATVEPSSAASDPNTSNNSATDTDALAPISGDIVVNGANGDATLVINATGNDSGTYQVTTNGVPGPVVPFDDATSFTFNGTPESQEGLDNDGTTGHDTMIVNNPSGGVFGPTGGVIFHGVGADHDSLQIQGGAASSEAETFGPNSADGSHNGQIQLVGASTIANYTYTNLSPVLINAGTPSDIVFNLPNNGQDNEVVLQASGTTGQSEIISQDGGFETTTFADPAGALGVNVAGSVGQTVTLEPLDAAFAAPTIVFNGGSGVNTLKLDAAGQPVETSPGALFLPNGGRAIRYASFEVLDVDNSEAVEAISGPDTADRATAFTGLNANERFVQTLYLDEMGRAGAKSELDGWAAVFNTPGFTQSQAQAAIATGVDDSPEARDHLVKSWYVDYLGRQAQGGEEQVWVNTLLAGQTEETTLSGILASTEFYNRAQVLVGSGTPDERFVQALYGRLLERTGEAGGVAAWVSAVQQLGRQEVARRFLMTTEVRTDDFEGYYNALLHRPDDQGGLNGWVFSNLDVGTVRVSFESTAEFYFNR